MKERCWSLVFAGEKANNILSDEKVRLAPRPNYRRARHEAGDISLDGCSPR